VKLVRPALLLSTVLVGTLALAGCSQGGTTAEAAAPAATTDPTVDRPAPFDGEPVDVWLVRQNGTADYFEAWGAGAEAQATAANIDLTVTDARSDNAKQASDLEQAILAKPAAIIVDHGQADTLEPGIDKAVEAGIPVIVYDVAVEEQPGVVVTSQSDEDLAQGALDQLVADIGEGGKVGLVTVDGYPALDRRTAVFTQVVEDNALDLAFKTGKDSSSFLTDNIPVIDAALKQHPDVQAIFAPYDELAKAAVQAVEQNGLEDSVKIYGIDISNTDIEVITKDGSPWVATAATDPAGVGAAVVRVAALTVTGDLDESSVSFPGVTFLQQDLIDDGITSVDQIVDANPGLVLGDVAVADWLSAVIR
jgi:simple sugar transport system substrate-binding protein